jgi:hypothetical protein
MNNIIIKTEKTINQQEKIIVNNYNELQLLQSNIEEDY